LIQNLKPRIKNLAKEIPLSKVVLFGSYAQGRSTVASDVDILVVYRGKERADSFAKVKKSLNIPLLEPHVYSEGEYEKLKDSMERMIADGVVLFSKRGKCG
jgi:predicted nucleotidyltransferase